MLEVNFSCMKGMFFFPGIFNDVSFYFIFVRALSLARVACRCFLWRDCLSVCRGRETLACRGSGPCCGLYFGVSWLLLFFLLV